MAWTVAFALLGALIFSMLVAPALASLLFQSGVKEWKNPVMGYLTDSLQEGGNLDYPTTALYGGGCGHFVCVCDVPGLQRSDRVGISAASG